MKKQLIILSVTLLTLSLHAKKERTKTVTELPGTMLNSIKLKGHSHLKSSKTDVIEVSGDKKNVLTAHTVGKATISEKDKQRGTIEVTEPDALRTIAPRTGEVVEGSSKLIPPAILFRGH